ncbi:MAG: DUF4491 family protein [Clostridiaceae bacterium]|jgi:hypothetical protein|nr:DUF4491 family protein [Clostridiaceae bacterium]
MNFQGIIIGVISFLVIGIFHPIVIKCEYYFSCRVWPFFLLAGIISILVSLFIANSILSSALGVLGCSCIWSIRELFEQRDRVAKGWFPANPKRK